jgi:hypothetical protein
VIELKRYYHNLPKYFFMSLKRLLVLLFLVLCSKTYSQLASGCATALPFSAGSSSAGISFPNTTNVPSPGAYSCLGIQPNAAWYYLQISQSGSLTLTIRQFNNAGNPIDVDFVAWGPFDAPACGVSNLNSNTQVGCSYSANVTETFTIPNAITGQYYMVMTTNFANQPGTISLTQTGGTGATNSDIICPLTVAGGGVSDCRDNILTANYINSAQTGTTFSWTFNGGNINATSGPNFVASPRSNNSTVNTLANGAGNYCVTARSPGCSSTQSAVCTTINRGVPVPFNPPINITACNNSTFDLTQNTSILLQGIPGGASNYEVRYNVNANNALTNTSPIPIFRASAFTGTEGQIIYATVMDNSDRYCIAVAQFTLNFVSCAFATTNTGPKCAGGTFNLSASDPGVGPVTYSWTGPNGFTATGANVNNIPTPTGTPPFNYVCTATPSTSGVTPLTSTTVLTVNPIPVATATPVLNSICSGTTTDIPLVSNVNGTTFAWTSVSINATGASNGTGSNIAQQLSASGNSVGTVDYTITPSANGCTGTPIHSIITVYPTAQVNQPITQVVCNGSTTSAVAFTTNNTGETTTYSWVNSDPSIGLTALGTGDIATFTAINTGTAPVIATITVTPTYTNGTVSCTGPTKTFTITVNPSSQVNQPIDQVVCNAGTTTAVAFTTNNTGGFTTYSWTNSVPSIGLAASGTGDIAGFTAINTGTAPIIAIIIIRPTYTNGTVSCAGPFRIFTITVNPCVPPTCGENYVDAGGLTGNYPNRVTATNGGTSVITPINVGDAVTVTFTSFVTAESTDRLRVYNGNGTSGTLLGTFSGTLTGANLPGPFTSSDPSGALTFVFTSDGSLNAAGWLADITCAPIPTCTSPSSLTNSLTTTNSASIGWIQPANPDLSTANAWQYIALPCGSTAPTATSTGWQAAPTNPFVVSGLTAGTCYDIYVRAVCSTTDVSAWSFRPVSFSTFPSCGDSFFDPGGASNYANNITAASGTTTICPSITGQVVTVTFNTFATESGRDLLRVYDGDTSAGTLLGTFSGTAIPGPFTAASTTGCLTFVFTSDTSLANSGWDASVTCGPRPPCAKPTTLTATAITQSTALLGWAQPANPDGSNATAWQVSAVPCGSGVPATGSSSWVNANSNPFYITGLASTTCYEYYVRAVCSTTESSLITGPFIFNTLISNDECTGAIEIPVNQNTNCLQTVQGSLAFATGSTNASSCDGTLDDDDVWFSFTATATSHYISLLGVNYSASPGLKYSLFTGSCGALTQLGGCTTNSTLPPNPSLNALTIGATYYIRVYSSGTTPVTTTFEICIGTNAGTCATALPLCAIAPIIIPNNVGVPTLPNPISPYSSTSTTVGCLGSAPSPTFYYFQFPLSGNYNFLLEQNTSNTFAAGTGIDVDFVAWGPYNSNAEACASISTANAPGTGVSCSFSAAATENFRVNNAIAGQVYVIMITNYDGRKGFVRITQTSGPVPIECCPFGNFSYSKNFYCQNEGNPSPSFVNNSVAGTFSAVPATGLSINPVTGLINLATSTPGTYIVHNVIGATGTCPSDDNSWSITIAAPLSGAAINYSSSSFCVLNTTVQNITQNGTPGGVYTVAPAVGLSLNTTTGSFNPSTSILGTYLVSYNLPQSGGCPGAISSTTVSIVLPVPTFNPAPPICVGGTSAPLPTTSLNGISGTWSPAINNSATTTYTFTPNAGQCGTTTTMTIEVGPVSPGFTQIAPICTGATLAALPTTSLNGVTGTWSPALSNTTTTTYTFTPGAGFCSTNTTMTITVNPISITPTFSVTAPICYRDTSSVLPLPTTSSNGITGTWSPALNNLATTTYTFTPAPGQCAFTATKTITVIPAFAVTVNSPTVCSGTIATVTATPSVAGTYTYNWTVPPGATNPGNVASFNATVSGVYTVVLTQLGCSSTRAAGNVTIATIQTPTFAAIPTICHNSVAPVLPTSSTNSTPITGTWNAAINTANLGSTTYTFTPAPNQCATSTTISVTIAASPIATFSYNSSAFCKTGANPVLALSVGSAAGVFTSSSTGLTLNSSTGAIDLSTSNPGNYTVANTIPAAFGCNVVSATFSITITAEPIAIFTYNGTPYCNNAPSQWPIFTPGGVAGTFTSTSGLSINAITGEINLAASTPGTYIVTNTIETSGGCSQVTASASLTINPQINVSVPISATYSNNAAVQASNFASSSPGAVYFWTNDNTSIGLAANGTGDIPSFTAINSTNAPITANIIVTPSLNGCSGFPSTYSITVAPTPTIGNISISSSRNNIDLFDTITVEVQVTNATDLYGLYMKLKGNLAVSQYLDYSGYTAGTLLGMPANIIATDPIVTNGNYDFGITKIGAVPGFSGSGLFYTFRFVTKNIPIPSGTNFCFYLDEISAYNTAGTSCNMTNQGQYCYTFSNQTNVWPGDLNNSRTVTTADLLPIGYFYNSTGLARPNATIQWTPQPAVLWGYNHSSINGNAYKVFADSNGDGVINNADQAAIGRNMNQTHLRLENPSQSSLTLTNGDLIVTPSTTSVNAATSQAVTFSVSLNHTGGLNALYGISVNLLFDNTIFDLSTATIDYTGSIFGTVATDCLVINHTSTTSESVGLTRYLNAPINGQGLLFKVTLQTRFPFNTQLTQTLVSSNVEAANNQLGDPLVIRDAPLANITIVNNLGVTALESTDFILYPNPVDDLINIAIGTNGAQLGDLKLKVINVLGQTVDRINIRNVSTEISTRNWGASGVYFVEITNSDNTVLMTKKVIVVRK